MNMPGRGHFDAHVAVVTGGGSGIGRATALALANAGAAVVVADVNGDAADAVVAEIIRAAGSAIAVRCDASDATDVATMVGRSVEQWGRLDLAVNAAGIDIENAPLASCDDQIFDRVVAVNLRATFLSLKYEIRAMVDQGGGSIVNVGSIASFRSSPGRCAYNASKAGVIALTKTAAIEYASTGIRVNALCPGPTETPLLEDAMERVGGVSADAAAMTLVGRLGTSDEMAGAVLWLLSPAADFVTGTALRVDGGVLAAFAG